MVISPTLSLSRWTFDCLMFDIRILHALLKRPLNGGRGHRLALRSWACALLAVLGLCVEQAQAVDAGEPMNDAKAWLNKIASSERNVSYQGTFIFRRDDQLVTMHLVHVVDQSGERERLSSLSGVQREFFRSKEGVVFFSPGQQHSSLNKEILRRNFPAQLTDGAKDLEKNYHLASGRS